MEIFNEQNYEDLADYSKNLDKLEVPYEILFPKDINERFEPLHFEGNYKGITEKLGGTLMASKCVAAFQQGLVILLKFFIN